MEYISVVQRVVVVLGGELLLAFDGIEYGVALSGAMDVVRNGDTAH
jgi:hypothetical protein